MTVTKKNGTTCSFEDHVGDANVIVVHFSASWWGACRGFKNKMVDAANKHPDVKVVFAGGE